MTPVGDGAEQEAVAVPAGGDAAGDRHMVYAGPAGRAQTRRTTLQASVMNRPEASAATCLRTAGLMVEVEPSICHPSPSGLAE